MAKQTFTTGQVLSAAQVNALQANDYNTTVSTKTASYVLVAADVGTTIVQNVATANTVTVNTGLFAAGDTLRIQNIGAGIATITAGTATVNTANSLALPQWGSGILYFTSASAAILFPSAGAAAAASGMTLISTTNLTTATTTITGISQSFTNLMIEIAGINIPTAQRLNVELRNGASAQALYLTGNNNAGFTIINGSSTVDIFAATITASDDRNVCIIQINNYKSTSSRKGVQIYGTTNDGGRFVNFGGGSVPTTAIDALNVSLTATPTAGTIRIFGV